MHTRLFIIFLFFPRPSPGVNQPSAMWICVCLRTFDFPWESRETLLFSEINFWFWMGWLHASSHKIVSWLPMYILSHLLLYSTHGSFFYRRLTRKFLLCLVPIENCLINEDFSAVKLPRAKCVSSFFILCGEFLLWFIYTHSVNIENKSWHWYRKSVIVSS
jgi:hypothetical protein